MPRLFISINCNDETKNLLISAQDRIREQSIKGSFSRPENLHLTLVFLGETPEAQIPAFCSVVEESAQLKHAAQQKHTAQSPVAPFVITFSHTGFFTHSNKELWWIGADRGDPFLSVLKNLRQQITKGLSALNIAFDNRSFNPHITLGREIKHSAPIVIPKQEIKYPVNRISLMKSQRLNGALFYTELFGQDLSGE